MSCYPSGALLASQMYVGEATGGAGSWPTLTTFGQVRSEFPCAETKGWTQSVSKRNGNGKMPKAVHLRSNLSGRQKT